MFQDNRQELLDQINYMLRTLNNEKAQYEGYIQQCKDASQKVERGMSALHVSSTMIENAIGSFENGYSNSLSAAAEKSNLAQTNNLIKIYIEKLKNALNEINTKKMKFELRLSDVNKQIEHYAGMIDRMLRATM